MLLSEPEAADDAHPSSTPTRTMPEEPEAGRNMSDGDNATPGLPGLPGPPGAGGDNPWLTRNPAAIAGRRAVGAQRQSRTRGRREGRAADR